MEPKDVAAVEQNLGRSLSTDERMFGELDRAGHDRVSSYSPKMLPTGPTDPIEAELVEARKRLADKKISTMSEDEYTVHALETMKAEKAEKEARDAANRQRAETVAPKLEKLEKLYESKKWAGDWDGAEWTRLRNAIEQGQSVVEGGDDAEFESQFQKVIALAESKKDALEKAIDLKRLQLQAEMDRLERDKELLSVEPAAAEAPPVESQPVDSESPFDNSIKAVEQLLRKPARSRKELLADIYAYLDGKGKPVEGD